jgi:hypothetical protein
VGADGLTLAGLAGYAWPHDKAAAASLPTAPATPDDARGVLHFVTRPDLTPAALTIAHHDGTRGTGTSPEYFILAPAGYPLTGPGVPGLMIMNRNGGIVWYSPNTGFPARAGQGRMDLKVQSYQGKPVLTWCGKGRSSRATERARRSSPTARTAPSPPSRRATGSRWTCTSS